MIKLVKWAYNRGVHQERMRIAMLLQDSQNRSYNDVAQYRLDLNNEKLSAKKRENIRFNLAIEDRVKFLIERLFEPRTEYIGFSDIFPDDRRVEK